MTPWMRRIVSVLLLLLGARAALSQGSSGAAETERSVRLRIVAASPASHAVSFIDDEPQPHFLATDTHVRLGAYEDVYPGIDVVAYGNEHYFEYAFVLAPGTTASRIQLAFDELRLMTMTEAGHVIYEGDGVDSYQQAPYAYRLTGAESENLPVRYTVAGAKGVGVLLTDQTPDERNRLNSHAMLLIPGGGQPGGPLYDFFMSQYETTNEQFLRFLNDAESHPKDPLGEFMYIDERGNAWFNEAMLPDQHEMFRIDASRFTYDPSKEPGERYDHIRNDKGDPLFADHPVTGVSWYGSLKYCNWLTIISGRGIAECAYTEGTNATDWAPLTATNWPKGVFGDAERHLWLSTKGFRLPMLNCDPLAITTNFYNEFFKAATWCATTNVTYGFGRDRFLGTDANAIDTINRHSVRTFPVGYFNGENSLDDLTTEPNDNFYMIFDLSGNVAEWMTDFGRQESTDTRCQCGGSWAQRLKSIYAGAIATPATASTAGGFRPMTTFMPDTCRVLHVLYCFHYPEGWKEGVKEPKEPISPMKEEPPPEGEELPPGGDLTPTGREIVPPGVIRPPTPPPPFVPPVIPSPPASPFIG